MGEYGNLGDLLAKAGRPAEAEPAYRRAVALFERPGESTSVPDPNVLARSEVGLATLLYAAGRVVEAEQEYRRAIGLAEKLTPDTQNDLAWALAANPNRGLPDLQVALQLAKNAVAVEPQNGGYWNTLGVAHYRVGDWKDAIAELEKSIELAPAARRRLVLPGHGSLAEWRKESSPPMVQKGRPVDGEKQIAGRRAPPLPRRGVSPAGHHRPFNPFRQEGGSPHATIEALKLRLAAEPGP